MKLKLLSLALFVSLFSISCTKDDDPDPVPTPDPTYPVAGLWIGTYTVTQQPGTGPFPYSFAFSPDGSVITAGKGANGTVYYSEGTWTMSADSIVTTTYKTINYPVSVTQSASLKYHSDGTMTDGTWTDVINPGGHISGSFQNIHRIN